MAQQQPQQRPIRAVNLRDLAEVSPDGPVKRGRVYRCSQIFSAGLLRELGIKTVIDLRGRSEARRAEATRMRRAAMGIDDEEGLRPLNAGREPAGAEGVDEADDMPTTEEAVAEDVAAAAVITAVPVEASLAASAPADATGATAPAPAASATTLATATMQFDLLPTWRLALEAVRRFPPSVFGQAALRLATLRDPSPVFAAAFANERLVGFRRYYSAILAGADSGRAIGDACRAIAGRDKLPGIIHCCHGKDRTGVVAMLLLQLCGVEDSAIAADYAQSERELRRYRESLRRPGPGAAEDDQGRGSGGQAASPIPLAEAIIAAQGDVALAVLGDLRRRYGGAERYLERRGRMSGAEIAALKEALTGE